MKTRHGQVTFVYQGPLTFAFVTTADQVRSGSSTCHEVDQFKRATGRKLALERALAQLDRKTRSEIWQDLWDSGMRKA